MLCANNYVPSSGLFQANLNIEGCTNGHKTDLQSKQVFIFHENVKKNIRIVVIKLKDLIYFHIYVFLKDYSVWVNVKYC